MSILRIVSCVLLIGIIIFSCKGKVEKIIKKNISIKDIGWSFQVIDNTKFTDSAFDSNGRIIEGYRKNGIQETISLFTLKESSDDWFTALLIKDTLSLEEWETRVDQDHEHYIKEISNLSNIIITDSIFTNEIIDGVNFKKEYFKFYNKRIKDTIFKFHYYGKFSFYELIINFSFKDNHIGKSYFEILKSSKFISKSNENH